MMKEQNCYIHVMMRLLNRDHWLRNFFEFTFTIRHAFYIWYWDISSVLEIKSSEIDFGTTMSVVGISYRIQIRIGSFW